MPEPVLEPVDQAKEERRGSAAGIPMRAAMPTRRRYSVADGGAWGVLSISSGLRLDVLVEPDTFSGSHVRFSARSRSYFASP